MRINIGEPNAAGPVPFGAAWYDWIIEPFIWLGNLVADALGWAVQELRTVAFIGAAVFLAILLLIKAV